MFGRFGRWLRDVVGVEPSVAERRIAIRATPFPDAWRAILEREVPHYRKLDEAQRTKLHGDIQIFIAEKTIVGIEGFEVHERARVLVAAAAAVLVLGRDISMLDHVDRVIIRPEVWTDDGDRTGGLYTPFERLRGDEVVGIRGEVELAWTQIDSAFTKPEGKHTPVHELAHAFDHADGELDALVRHPHYDRWRARLRELPLDRRRVGRYLVTDIIGDVEGPELFANASTLFFECPRRLHGLDADLFAALVAIYAIDPRSLVDH